MEIHEYQQQMRYSETPRKDYYWGINWGRGLFESLVLEYFLIFSWFELAKRMIDKIYDYKKFCENGFDKDEWM